MRLPFPSNTRKYKQVKQKPDLITPCEQRTIRSDPFDEIEIEDSQANFLSQGSSVGSLGAGCYFLPTILALVSFDSASSSNSSSKGKRTVGVARLAEAAN
ncbi:hypothetical protein SDJN03_15771, partial [Cucurbita argyrosperma subsp. sororia]